jgi:hypothetical protein
VGCALTCHLGARVCSELLFSVVTLSRRPVFCSYPSWPEVRQGVCALGVRCLPVGFICMIFRSGFPYKRDHIFSRKLNTMTSSSPACLQKKVVNDQYVLHKKWYNILISGMPMPYYGSVLFILFHERTQFLSHASSFSIALKRAIFLI